MRNNKLHGVVWTSQMIYRFRQLVADKNLSYQEIAAKMSKEFDVVLSKNACIGKGRRLGVEARVPGIIRSKKAAVIPKRKYVRVDAPILPKAVIPRDPDKGLTIYELREGDCKWVLDKMEAYPPFMFCGMPAIVNCSWCKKHRQIAYSTVRERAA